MDGSDTSMDCRLRMMSSNNQSPRTRRRQEVLDSTQQTTTTAHPPPPHCLYKPHALKATTIHPRLLRDFQEQCVQEQLPPEAHRAALQQSEEWHRRWTLQGELGHTQPHDANDWQHFDSQESDFLLDREGGAKNPSLRGSNESSPCTSGGAQDDAWSLTTSEDEGPAHRTTFRQPTGTPLLRPVSKYVEAQPDISPLQLPECVLPPDNNNDLEAPKHSSRPDSPAPQQRSRRHDSPSYFVESPSPLTLPSASSSIVSHRRRIAGAEESGYESSTSTTSSSTGSVSAVSLPSTVSAAPCYDIEGAKDKLLELLAVAGGDVNSRPFKRALVPLWKHYRELGWDARQPHTNAELQVEGMWLTLSKPTFFGNLGENNEGDPMYTLGRMAFDMFLPTQLVVSLQGNFNPVHVVPEAERQHTLENKVPKALVDEVIMGNHVLRTYNIVSAFTIEPHMAAFPDAPNKKVRRPIKGIMTTYGYVLPDPAVPNRLSIWFTGGKIAPNDDPDDQQEWRRLFGAHQPQRTLGEKVRVLAANLLMGAEVPKEMNPEDGSFEFTFSRPLGGHGVAYMDVLYLDQSMRVCRGHRGTIFVFARIPDHSAF